MDPLCKQSSGLRYGMQLLFYWVDGTAGNLFASSLLHFYCTFAIHVH